MRWIVFAAGVFVLVLPALTADADISNRVALRNERLERYEFLQRCTAFFELIAAFRDRRPNEAERLGVTAKGLFERAAEVLAQSADLAPDAANEENARAVEAYLGEYRTELRETFGPVQSETFRTYDLLLMQEDLRFCKELTEAERLAPRRPLPAR
ncbi:MAG: hypothetical protein AAF526_10935 [Pseudomonadota bacterium]